MTRDEAIKRIRTALKTRSGKTWSVTGGRGTDWGWIRIISVPSRRTEYGSMQEDDRSELSQLLGTHVHHQGESIPASRAYYQEFVNRAETGQNGGVTATPYWD